MSRLILFFFFQAEDGIRDLTVTGVQTCALPISHVVELESVLELDDEAARLAAGIGRALLRDGIDDGDLRRVLRTHLGDRDLRPRRLDTASLAEPDALLRGEPREVDHRGDEPSGPQDLRSSAPA